MDWILTPQISFAGLLAGSMTVMLLWYGVDQLCAFVGRRRDQRRTEARLAVEKREWDHTEAAELDSHNPGECAYCLQEAFERTMAGAPSPQDIRTSGDGKNG